MKVSTAAVLLTKRTLPFSDSLSAGVAVSTQRMAPKRSTSKFARQAFSPVPFPPVGLLTRMSSPPSASTAEVTKRFSASPSATSTASATTLEPRASRSFFASSTPSFVRAQIATLAPSSANRPAMARPMPRLPPVTIAFSPFRPRSIPTPPQASSGAYHSVRRSADSSTIIRMAHDSIMSNRWTQELYVVRSSGTVGPVFLERVLAPICSTCVARAFISNVFPAPASAMMTERWS